MARNNVTTGSNRLVVGEALPYGAWGGGAVPAVSALQWKYSRTNTHVMKIFRMMNR